MWHNILLVGIGSMFGGISRYLVSMLIKQASNSSFPIGTFFVNVAGCFLIGLISATFSHECIHENHRMLLSVGFCGSFTTFSTFATENMHLLAEKEYLLLSLYIIASILVGLFAVWFGFWVCNKHILH